MNKEQEIRAVDQAWERLYQRLEKDGLLNEERAVKQGYRNTVMSRWVSIAAIFVVCIFTGWYFMRKDTSLRVISNDAHAPTLATMLEDGSVVFLSKQTSLTLSKHFDDQTREVMLQGEAYFNIKKNPECPFIIHTAIARIEVVGTAFKLMCEQNDSFFLSVQEGEVRVTQKNHHQALIAKAGATVFFDSGQLCLKTNDAPEKFDRSYDRIHFKDERLVDAASILNLYSDSLQLIVDPSIEKRITFTYVLNRNMVEVAEAICLALELHCSQTDHVVHISK